MVAELFGPVAASSGSYRDVLPYPPGPLRHRMVEKGCNAMATKGWSSGTVDTMSGSDALLWTISSDPVMRPTIVALMVLDGKPDWVEVRARVSALTEAVPRLRSRAVTRAPGRGRPQFVLDKNFVLEMHLRHMRLPEHGGLRDVIDMAQTMATSGFDHAQPLWEAILVEDSDVDRAFLVMKVHHALIDGVGGLAVLAQLFDPVRPGREGKKAGPAPRESNPRSRRPTPARVPALLDPVRLVGDALDLATHPVRSVGQLIAIGTSLGRLMAPAKRPMSPIMTGRSFRRHVEIIELDLKTLKRAAKLWGGTVNDVFVASVVRGLTLYHEQHGVAALGFRALMPVNVRDATDREGGNHFVPARFVIPVHRDVADSVAEARRRAEQWKHAAGLSMSDVLATGLSVLPAPVARGLWSSMLMGDDFCITNIPGPPFQAFLDGKAVKGIFAISPPSGAAFNVSLVSVGKRACITITTDVAAIPDSPKLAGCLEDGFSEVCSARPPVRPLSE
jgi:diacylglycerol O-acyltransferase / wax synthase